jgi:acyl carrier protein phosphodiesterase
MRARFLREQRGRQTERERQLKCDVSTASLSELEECTDIFYQVVRRFIPVGLDILFQLFVYLCFDLAGVEAVAAPVVCQLAATEPSA